MPTAEVDGDNEAQRIGIGVDVERRCDAGLEASCVPVPAVENLVFIEPNRFRAKQRLRPDTLRPARGALDALGLPSVPIPPIPWRLPLPIGGNSSHRLLLGNVSACLALRRKASANPGLAPGLGYLDPKPAVGLTKNTI